MTFLENYFIKTFFLKRYITYFINDLHAMLKPKRKPAST